LWAGDPQNRTELDAMQRAWTHSFPLERPIDVDMAWSAVAAAMRVQDRMRGGSPAHEASPEASHDVVARGNLQLHKVDPADHVARGHVLRPTMDRVARPTFARHLAVTAAAAAVLVAAGIPALRMAWRSNPAGSSRTAAVARTTSYFVARRGQRALIDLADGTHIVLAPASRLSVSLPVGTRGERDLSLDGEAMFTVTHDAARPFVVHSRYGTTVDVGTSFAVRAYAGERYRVVVRDGSVALADAGKDVLVAGDVASRSDDGTMHIAHAQDAAGLLDWTSGRLTFQHERLGELVPEFERWFGVTIHIATPSLRDRIITGQLDTESPSEAMEAIARTLGAQHTIHGTHVTFSMAGDER
jgi:ferric-dicitrate binding protein FerR (iron transport regulator)